MRGYVDIDNLVEVVRCKDCKFGSENGKYGCLLHRTHDGIMGTMKTMLADDFCSYGERKDE